MIILQEQAFLKAQEQLGKICVLEDWLQRLCVKESFSEAVSGLRMVLNLAPSERAAEQMSRRVAADADALQL